MKKNAKTLLVAAGITFLVIAVIAVLIMEIRPFFNIANVVSGGP